MLNFISAIGHEFCRPYSAKLLAVTLNGSFIGWIVAGHLTGKIRRLAGSTDLDILALLGAETPKVSGDFFQRTIS